MNAPTGRNARVSVSDSAIAASDLPKSLPIAVSVMTTRKKSNASSIQPRKPAATVAFWSVLVGRGVVSDAVPEPACALLGRVERGPQPPQYVSERPVRPEMHVVELGLVPDQMAVQRRRRDAVRRQRAQHRRDFVAR